MSTRHLPVRPNLEHLRHEAKNLLRQIQSLVPEAISDLNRFHPRPPEPGDVKLSDAQWVLAISYGAPSWPRLVIACKMTNAIWNGDVSSVQNLVLKNPKLLLESARGVHDENWGPPMSYAANVGQDEIIRVLKKMGAADVQHAFDRATLQGRLDTARMLLEMGAKPMPGCVMGPCETLNPAGLKLLLDLGAELADDTGNRFAPVGLVLEIYARNPEGKHGCLDLIEANGIDLPDTPVMAVHRGRIDRLEKFLRDDPQLFTRTYSHEDIYPLSLGCHLDPTLALNGTPIDGGTLLHLCVDFDEIDVASWMFEHGADANAKADVDQDGFGGHTALFGCVVSQPYRCGRQKDGSFTKLLLNNGAETSVRASLKKELRFVADETLHEYLNVTPHEWGKQFHDQDWVNPAAMRFVES